MNFSKTETIQKPQLYACAHACTIWLTEYKLIGLGVGFVVLRMLLFV